MKFFLCMTLCAAAAWTPPPLSDRVDIETLTSLATFAAADRICRAAPSEVSRRQAFRRCMHAQKDLTACDATADDLADLRALMRVDARLSAVAPFESVVDHIAGQCGARVEPRPELPLTRKCESSMPVLLAHAVALRIPPDGVESNMLAQQECAGTDGKLFLLEECFDWGSPRGRSVAEVERLRPKYLEYFCPLKIREWPDPNSRKN